MKNPITPEQRKQVKAGKHERIRKMLENFHPSQPEVNDELTMLIAMQQRRRKREGAKQQCPPASKRGQQLPDASKQPRPTLVRERGKPTKMIDEEKRKASRKRYEQSAKGRARRRRYAQSERGRATQSRYNHSDKGMTRRAWAIERKLHG